MARDEDRCINDDIQRVRERMVDEFNERKIEHQSILSAIRTGFREVLALHDAKRASGGFSNSDHLWKLGYAAAAAVSYFLAKVVVT